jgi:hypothetical protein
MDNIGFYIISVSFIDKEEPGKLELKETRNDFTTNCKFFLTYKKLGKKLFSVILRTTTWPIAILKK